MTLQAPHLLHLRDFLEAVPDAMIVVDGDRRVLQVNVRTEALLGRSREQLLGHELDECLGDHQDRIEISSSRLPTGEDLLVVRGVDFRDRGGHQDGIWTSETRLRALLESTRAIPWEASAKNWQFTYVGPQAVELLGYPIERWYEKDFWTAHIHPDDRKAALQYCMESSRRFKDYDFEYRMIDSSGNAVWLHDVVNVASVNGAPEFLRGFMIDITDRKLAEARLRDLSGRLIHAQEEERRRIARELHDDMSQRVGLLGLELDRLGQAQVQPSDFAERMQELRKQANDLSSHLHRLSYELHPSMITHLGLVAAVRSFCRELSRQQGIRVEFLDREVPRAMPEDVSLCLFRITQETLRNVVKHSGAADARVELIGEGDGGGVRLRISDSGVGFDPEVCRNGLGLVSMEERLRLVGGEITIDSRPNEGARIDVRVPLPS